VALQYTLEAYIGPGSTSNGRLVVAVVPRWWPEPAPEKAVAFTCHNNSSRKTTTRMTPDVFRFATRRVSICRRTGQCGETKWNKSEVWKVDYFVACRCKTLNLYILKNVKSLQDAVVRTCKCAVDICCGKRIHQSADTGVHARYHHEERDRHDEHVESGRCKLLCT